MNLESIGNKYSPTSTTTSRSKSESDSDTNDNNSESIATVLAAKKMMAKIKKHVIEDGCNCCKRTLEND